MKTTIDIPDDLFPDSRHFLDKTGEIFRLGLLQLKIQEALMLYEKGLVSFGRGAELAGLSRDEMIHQAKARGIMPMWSEEMVHEELR